jgi:hypothetical protein
VPAEEEAAHRKAVLAQQLRACGVSKLQQSQSAARLHHVARHRALAQALQRGHIAVAALLCAARPAQKMKQIKQRIWVTETNAVLGMYNILQPNENNLQVVQAASKQDVQLP